MRSGDILPGWWKNWPTTDHKKTPRPGAAAGACVVVGDHEEVTTSMVHRAQQKATALHDPAEIRRTWRLVFDAEQVTACERHLASATQSQELPAPLRWTAGILAGRLIASYRYDYAGARSYYRQAQRAAEPGSLEEMTARWWYADALTREGENSSARAAYDAILTEYGAKWPRAHITQRATARMAHPSKGR